MNMMVINVKPKKDSKTFINLVLLLATRKPNKTASDSFAATVPITNGIGLRVKYASGIETKKVKETLLIEV